MLGERPERTLPRRMKKILAHLACSSVPGTLLQEALGLPKYMCICGCLVEDACRYRQAPTTVVVWQISLMTS